MWIYFLLGTGVFLGAVATLLLFLPIRVEIDSREGKYRLAWVPVLGIRWVVDAGAAEVEFFGMRHRMSRGNVKKPARPAPRKRTPAFRMGAKQVWALVQTFRIKKWRVCIDTGNMALNGRLFPLCYLLGLHMGKRIQVNFLGINEVAITVESNLYRMAKALLLK